MHDCQDDGAGDKPGRESRGALDRLLLRVKSRTRMEQHTISA